MWMSDASFLIASVRIRLTSLTTGASSDSRGELRGVDVVGVLDDLDVRVVEVGHHVVECSTSGRSSGRWRA